MDHVISELIKTLQEDKPEDISVTEIQKKICENIIQQVKKEEQEFDFDELRKAYPDKNFWDVIERRVIRQTKNYIKLSLFRQLGKESRVKLCSEVFETVYFERENVSYVVEF